MWELSYKEGCKAKYWCFWTVMLEKTFESPLDSKESKALSSKASFFGAQLSLWFNSHIHTWLLEKPQLWLYRPLSSQWCLCFLICCLVCHSFPYKDQASFNSMAAVTIHSDFVAQGNQICHCSHFFPFYLPWSDGPDAMILVFLRSLSSFTLIERLFHVSSLSASSWFTALS